VAYAAVLDLLDVAIIVAFGLFFAAGAMIALERPSP
jgi:hypothetical protein